MSCRICTAMHQIACMPAQRTGLSFRHVVNCLLSTSEIPDRKYNICWEYQFRVAFYCWMASMCSEAQGNVHAGTQGHTVGKLWLVDLQCLHNSILFNTSQQGWLSLKTVKSCQNFLQVVALTFAQPFGVSFRPQKILCMFLIVPRVLD